MGTLTEPCQSRAVWSLGSGGGRGLCLLTDRPLTSQEPQEALSCLQYPWNGAEQAPGQKSRSEARAKMSEVRVTCLSASAVLRIFLPSHTLARSSASPNTMRMLGSMPFTGSANPASLELEPWTEPLKPQLSPPVTCSGTIWYEVKATKEAIDPQTVPFNSA